MDYTFLVMLIPYSAFLIIILLIVLYEHYSRKKKEKRAETIKKNFHRFERARGEERPDIEGHRRPSGRTRKGKAHRLDPKKDGEKRLKTDKKHGSGYLKKKDGKKKVRPKEEVPRLKPAEK